MPLGRAIIDVLMAERDRKERERTRSTEAARRDLEWRAQQDLLKQQLAQTGAHQQGQLTALANDLAQRQVDAERKYNLDMKEAENAEDKEKAADRYRQDSLAIQKDMRVIPWENLIPGTPAYNARMAGEKTLQDIKTEGQIKVAQGTAEAQGIFKQTGEERAKENRMKGATAEMESRLKLVAPPLGPDATPDQQKARAEIISDTYARLWPLIARKYKIPPEEGGYSQETATRGQGPAGKTPEAVMAAQDKARVGRSAVGKAYDLGVEALSAVSPYTPPGAAVGASSVLTRALFTPGYTAEDFEREMGQTLPWVGAIQRGLAPAPLAPPSTPMVAPQVSPQTLPSAPLALTPEMEAQARAILMQSQPFSLRGGY